MKIKSTLLALLVGFALSVAGTPDTASAQDTIAAPTPATASRETTVYLSKDYTKALEANKLFDADKFTAIFLGFQGEFALFRAAGSREQIYIPKSAILYMRGPGEPRVGTQY